jgi:hypothetical protein
MSSNRLANDAGILATNTWRYYIQNFGCSHFKGRGIEDNIYLLRPLFLNNGERVRNRATFRQAIEEGIIVERIDYIFNDHQAAVTAAKFFYHPELFEEADFYYQLRYYERNFILRFGDIRDHIVSRAFNLERK